MKDALPGDGAPSSFLSRFRKAVAAGQIARFLLVGGVAFILYFVLEYGLEKAGLQPYASLSAAYAITLAYHYTMNRIYTFGHRGALRAAPGSLAKYAVVNIGHYFLTVAIVAAGRQIGLDMRIGMLAAVAVTTVTGYLAYRHWVFSI